MTEDLNATPGWTIFKHRASWRQDFSLRGLLQAFSQSLCSDVRDKIYGFLGLASIKTGHQIAVDYRKSAVEIAVDVLRSQCQPWVLAESDFSNHNFVRLLLQSLETSHAELAAYVLGSAPDLRPYLGIIATKELAETYMTQVCTVITSSIRGATRARRDSGLTGGPIELDTPVQVDDHLLASNIWHSDRILGHIADELLHDRNQGYLRLSAPPSISVTISRPLDSITTNDAMPREVD